MNNKYKYTDDVLKEAIKNSLSLRQVLDTLGLKPAGGNYAILKKRIKALNISTEHFLGRAWNKGRKFAPRTNIQDKLKTNTSVQTHKLRQQLITQGLKKAVCECCGLDMWMDKPIKLELHHINGDRTDNRLENLQLLCPNCHAYTDNYRGRNVESARIKRSEVERRKFEEALTGDADGNLEPSPKREGVETRHDDPKADKAMDKE